MRLRDGGVGRFKRGFRRSEKCIGCCGTWDGRDDVGLESKWNRQQRRRAGVDANHRGKSDQATHNTCSLDQWRFAFCRVSIDNLLPCMRLRSSNIVDGSDLAKACLDFRPPASCEPPGYAGQTAAPSDRDVPLHRPLPKTWHQVAPLKHAFRASSTGTQGPSSGRRRPL